MHPGNWRKLISEIRVFRFLTFPFSYFLLLLRVLRTAILESPISTPAATMGGVPPLWLRRLPRCILFS